MHNYKYMLAVVVITFSTIAGAQTLFKCKDACGKVTYSDIPCRDASVETIKVVPNVFDGSAFRMESERRYALSKDISKQSEHVIPKTKSYACTEAIRAYEFEKTSVRFDRAATAKKKRVMEKACGYKPKQIIASEDTLDRRGCCSHHGGVCGCSGPRIKCCDGSLSPSCGC